MIPELATHTTLGAGGVICLVLSGMAFEAEEDRWAVALFVLGTGLLMALEYVR